MTLTEALELLERTARSSVSQLEPRDCAAIAQAIRARPCSDHAWRATETARGEWVCTRCGQLFNDEGC